MQENKRFGIHRFVAGVVAGLLLSLAGLFIWFQTAPAQAMQAPGSSAFHEGFSEPVQILVLGVDERSQDQGRSDTMMLVRVGPGDTARVLSIPRDTLVKIDGYGEGKANSAYTYGGPELAKRSVSELLGVPVQYYVKVNMAGFRDLVDLMGGVTVDVAKPMHYEDPTDGLKIDLDPGRQLLDGQKAEQFVRFRHDEIGDDVGRIHRQQEFLKAAADQLLSPGNLPRLPRLLYTAAEHVQTDLPLPTQLRLGYALYSAKQGGAMVQETLPGRGDYVGGISFFLPDRGELEQLLAAWRS